MSASQGFDTFQHEFEERRRQFIEDCAFTKVVETCNGPALLIGGTVIGLRSLNANHADWLARALRRSEPSQQNQTAAEIMRLSKVGVEP